jgi:hypothetical protein
MRTQKSAWHTLRVRAAHRIGGMTEPKAVRCC